MANESTISVQVCYADLGSQEIISLSLPAQSSVLHAIELSGIVDKYSEIDLAKNNIGIYGNIVSLDHVLSNNDRVEIYRSLRMDPMQARRLRAELKN